MPGRAAILDSIDTSDGGRNRHRSAWHSRVTGQTPDFVLHLGRARSLITRARRVRTVRARAGPGSERLTTVPRLDVSNERPPRWRRAIRSTIRRPVATCSGRLEVNARPGGSTVPNPRPQSRTCTTTPPFLVDEAWISGGRFPGGVAARAFRARCAMASPRSRTSPTTSGHGPSERMTPSTPSWSSALVTSVLRLVRVTSPSSSEHTSKAPSSIRPARSSSSRMIRIDSCASASRATVTASD